MAPPFVIIDGYNLMHAIGLARRTYGPGDLEACRNRLLVQLSNRLSEEACRRTTVVFDAFEAVDDDHREQVRHGLNVVYAPAGTDADSQIERIIADHSSPRQLWVVSSDHRLHRAARRRRALCIDSEPFWESLDPPNSSPARQAESPADTATGTLDAEFDADYLADLESELDD